MTVAVAVAALMGSCDQSPSGAGAFGVTGAPCLVQVRSGRVEVIRLDGTSTVRRLPGVAFHATVGDISSDGAWAVVFTADDRLVAVAIDGRVLWELATRRGSAPLISPDRSRVAYRAEGGLAAYSPADGTAVMLGIGGSASSWSRDGSQLVYSDGRNVGVFDFRTGHTSPLGAADAAGWGLGDRTVLLRSAPDTIESVTLDDGGRQRFVEGPGIGIPRWSRDGRWMVVTRDRQGDFWTLSGAMEPHDVVVTDTATHTTRVVGEFYKANPGQYRWVHGGGWCDASMQ